MFLQPGADGLAVLGAELSADEAAEAYAQLDQLARMATADGDSRPIAGIRTELFSLLLRRPDGHGRARPRPARPDRRAGTADPRRGQPGRNL